MVRYPSHNTWAGWCAAFIAFIAADLITGSDLMKTLLLTLGNFVGVLVGCFLFSKVNRDIATLHHPRSIIYLITIVTIASAACGIIGTVANPILFGGEPLAGFILWSVTEFVNYLAILPVILTFPAMSSVALIGYRNVKAFFAGYLWVPCACFIATLALGINIREDVALVFPIPALLLCSLYYNVFVTSILTLGFCVWALLMVSLGHITTGADLNSYYEIILFRGGVSMIALAPITVSIIMTVRNELLQVASKAREEAEEALATRSLLLAMMTHELRTPLNAIIGFSEATAMQIFGPVGNKSYLEYANHVNDAGNHLLSLVNDLLDTAKVEMGEYELTFATIPTRDVIEQSVRLVSGIAKEHKISIVILPAEWPHAIADHRAIKQVMLNLLSNAIKFSEVGGKVNINAKTENDRLTIEVQDFGQGVESTELKLLGKPYAQARSTKRLSSGTGLGLALSRSLIEQHGGKLTLDSKLGCGMLVLFDLEIAKNYEKP